MNDIVAPDSFETCRPALIELAHRILGDLAQADDIVLEAWLQWHLSGSGVDAPRGRFLDLVARLCNAEIEGRDRCRRVAGDRRFETGDAAPRCPARTAVLDRASMALVGLLHRLSPTERAALLLHDVFQFGHADMARLMKTSEAQSRRLHRHASEDVARGREAIATSRDEHHRILRAFLRTAAEGDVAGIQRMLTEDPVLIADGGRAYLGGQPKAVSGPAKIAALVAALARKPPTGQVERRDCELNGEPAVMVLRDGKAYAAVLVSVAHAKIRQVFVHADARHL